MIYRLNNGNVSVIFGGMELFVIKVNTTHTIESKRSYSLFFLFCFENLVSDNAKQIIQLICMLAFLLIIRYGSVFYRYIKTKKYTTNQINNKFSIILRLKNFFNLLKDSYRLSSILFYFLVIFLTCVTLLIKQILLTSTNTIDPFRNQINTTQTTLCFIIYHDYRINLTLLPISCLYVFISFINRRNNSKSNRCFSLPIPLNYFSIKHRLFYASISIILTHYLFDLIRRTSNETTVITTFLFQLFDVLTIYLRYYPILICFYKKSIYSLVFGSIYILINYSMMILENALCQSQPSPLIIDVPIFLSFSYILILFLKQLLQQFALRRKKNLTIREKILQSLTPEEQFLCENLSNSSSFQYSIRIISIYSSMIYLMYYIIIQTSIEIPTKLIEFENKIKYYFSLVFLTIPMPNLIRSYFISLFLTSCVLIIQLIILLRTIRTDLLNAYKGKLKKLQLQSSEHILYSRGNISFAGLFIGTLIWNFIILMTCLIIILSILEILISYGNIQLFEQIINIVVPSFLFYFIKDSISELLCQYVLLQNRSEHFSINNFRFLMIFIHLNYLFDSLVGFIFGFLRLVQTWIVSMIYMIRFDNSLFGRKFEEYDFVYTSYQAFIYFESTHRNPIMRLFLSNVYLQMKIQQHCNSCSKLKYANRWKLAYFLIKNPSLQQSRRQINRLKIC